MSLLATLARQSLAQFVIVYTEIYDGSGIPPEELDALMWARMCAKEANITPAGFRIPFDNIRRAKVTLPYLPDLINYTGCCAIKKNGGLYTPCCGKTLEDSYYCKTCSLDKEGEFKELEFGAIEDRESNVEEEVFAPISFGEWMKGHKTTLPEVYDKLRAAGVPIEIPARELTVRDLPKRRKGRPTRSEDSVEDEDSPKKAKKASGSESDAPKKKASKAESDAPKAKAKKASKAESESESDVPTKKAKAKKASGSESDVPKKAKAKKAESDVPKEKAPKAKASKASKAESDAPKKKASKAESESETEKPKAKASKGSSSDSSDLDSDARAARKAAKKAAKAAAEAEAAEAEAKAAKKAAKKAKAAEDAKKAKAALEDGELEEEEEEIEGEYEQDCEIEGKDYNLRNGKIICDKENGEILGSLDENGDPVWNSEKR